MKKLMKKKVSILGKSVSVFAIVMVAMIGLAAAALVDYISNPITGTIEVDSPIKIMAISIDGDGAITKDDGSEYAVSIYGGESFSVNTRTDIYVDGVTGHISENMISDFDGQGITITYTDDNFPDGYFELDVCTSDGDAYFYIGNPNQILNATVLYSTTTFTAALNLDPDTSLTVNSRVILDEFAACAYGSPTYVAN